MSELDKLREYLEEKGIEYEWHDEGGDSTLDTADLFKPIVKMLRLERHQIIVFENGKRVWDAICHHGSFGYNEGLLEVMGEPVVKPSDGDTVCGYLTAEDVIERWEEYKSNGGMWI